MTDTAAPADYAAEPAEDLIPQATLPPEEIDARYESLIRHLSDLPHELAPALGSAQHLVGAIQADHHAGLTRSAPEDYHQAISILRILRDTVQQTLDTVAVVSTKSGLSIDRAADALQISANTLRRKLPGKTESITPGAEVADDDQPF